ncbi:hypothetical protein HJG60_009404 [Phyllostomus discolor]|uniref:Uncharacterized protein n=1 Tax=Phyllostomus discolor TaxID=89673 RepID=A0A833YIR5_9CHIR|nr:hypothetical protein HJG60_009404 [Phyllostomus discolor]
MAAMAAPSSTTAPVFQAGKRGEVRARGHSRRGLPPCKGLSEDFQDVTSTYISLKRILLKTAELPPKTRRLSQAGCETLTLCRLSREEQKEGKWDISILYFRGMNSRRTVCLRVDLQLRGGQTPHTASRALGKSSWVSSKLCLEAHPEFLATLSSAHTPRET